MALRQAICAYSNELLDSRLKPAQVTVTPFGMQGLMLTAEFVVTPGIKDSHVGLVETSSHSSDSTIKRAHELSHSRYLRLLLAFRYRFFSCLITKNALTQRKTPWCVSREHHEADLSVSCRFPLTQSKLLGFTA
jgi:hypothetical protein